MGVGSEVGVEARVGSEARLGAEVGAGEGLAGVELRRGWIRGVR